MTHLELTFNTDDPKLSPLLAEIGGMPRVAARLRLEAALCQWWANKCLEKAGAYEDQDRRDSDRTARAKATREAKRLAAGGAS